MGDLGSFYLRRKAYINKLSNHGHNRSDAYKRALSILEQDSYELLKNEIEEPLKYLEKKGQQNGDKKE